MTASSAGVSIHQPSYFPWLGLLDKIASSSLYVLMDEVQLADRDYQHRNLFLTERGEQKFLTITIAKKGFRSKNIKDIELAGSQWQADHLNFLKHNYRRAPFFEETLAVLEPLYVKPYTWLLDVLLESMRISAERFGIDIPIRLQSELAYDRESRKSDLILSLVKASGARVYICGQGAKAYMELTGFAEAGVDVRFQEFQHPQYPQVSSPGGFIPGMSCVDAMFNVGAAACPTLLPSLPPSRQRPG